MDPTRIENTYLIVQIKKKRIRSLVCIMLILKQFPLFFIPKSHIPKCTVLKYRMASFMLKIGSNASSRLKRYLKKIKKIRKIF